METEKHYFKVGLFVLVVLGAFIAYLIMFGGENTNRDLKRYAVYFDHSVEGLERGAPVKLRGIVVGLVDNIRFVSPENDRILVIADISESAPVRSDTVATVSSQGIAGATFLALENTDPAATLPQLTVPDGEKYPVIKSKESAMQALMEQAPAIEDKLARSIDQTQKLLSDKNINGAEALLPEAHDALTEAASAFREIKMLARELRDDPSIILHGAKYDGYKVPK